MSSKSQTLLEDSSFRRLGLRTFLLKGASLIALATLLERGFLFLANVFSARIAGAEHFGAYGLALQTAGFMASQAGLGIGMVACRFAAEYPVGHALNRDFVHRIIHLSVGLAFLASILMLAFAWPLANWFYNKPVFFRVLVITIFSAPAFVMLDAVRGLLIGVSYYRGMVILSTIFGISMLILMPWAAIRGARWMVLTHAVCSFMTCLSLLILLNHKFHLKLLSFGSSQVPLWPMLRFGILQVGTGTAVSLVMMTMMAMLVRYASREEMIATALLPLGVIVQQGTVWLVTIGLSYYPIFGFREVGYYNAASSVRNIASILPGMLHQTMISLMTNKRGDEFGGANRVLLINTWMSAFFLIPVTSLGLIFMPWFLPFFFGRGFMEGVMPACFLLAVGLIHMVAQPAVNRLTILSPRAVMIAHVFWIVSALGSAFFLAPMLGATGVALSLLIAHSVAALVVPLMLAWYGNLPEHFLTLTLFSMMGAVVPLLFVEEHHHPLVCWTNGMILVVMVVLMLLIWSLRGPLRTR